MYIRFTYISSTIWELHGQGKDNMHVCNVLMNKFIVTVKQIILLCSKFTQLKIPVKVDPL